MDGTYARAIIYGELGFCWTELYLFLGPKLLHSQRKKKKKRSQHFLEEIYSLGLRRTEKKIRKLKEIRESKR